MAYGSIFPVRCDDPIAARRSGSRQAFGPVLAFGAVRSGSRALAIDYYVVTMPSGRPKRSRSLPSDDDEIYTGSILYMPDDMGNVCRQLLFDNQNGQFTDNGYVDCARAAYQGRIDGPKRWSAARLRVISTGFLQH